MCLFWSCARQKHIMSCVFSDHVSPFNVSPFGSLSGSCSNLGFCLQAVFPEFADFSVELCFSSITQTVLTQEVFRFRCGQCLEDTAPTYCVSSLSSGHCPRLRWAAWPICLDVKVMCESMRTRECTHQASPPLWKAWAHFGWWLAKISAGVSLSTMVGYQPNHLWPLPRPSRSKNKGTTTLLLCPFLPVRYAMCICSLEQPLSAPSLVDLAQMSSVCATSQHADLAAGCHWWWALAPGAGLYPPDTMPGQAPLLWP